jgi:hypothetical protein
MKTREEKIEDVENDVNNTFIRDERSNKIYITDYKLAVKQAEHMVVLKDENDSEFTANRKRHWQHILNELRNLLETNPKIIDYVEKDDKGK